MKRKQLFSSLLKPLLIHYQIYAMSIASLQLSTTCQYLLQGRALVQLRLGVKFLLPA